MNILEKKKISWWQTVLLAGTVLAAFLKIYIGMDNDESYIVTMGVRLLNGDRIFKEMWELHMAGGDLCLGMGQTDRLFRWNRNIYALGFDHRTVWNSDLCVCRNKKIFQTGNSLCSRYLCG